MCNIFISFENLSKNKFKNLFDSPIFLKVIIDFNRTPGISLPIFWGRGNKGVFGELRSVASFSSLLFSFYLTRFNVVF